MKKLLLSLMLALISTSASAEWTKVTESAGIGGNIVYIDLATIHPKGSKVKMWSLYDYKVTNTLSAYKFLSMKIQDEYDCKEKKTRTLALSLFSGNMGAGKVVFTNSDIDGWEPVTPGSALESLWKAACGKK